MSLRRLALVSKTALVASCVGFFSVPAFAIDFGWSFVNQVPFANAGNAGDVITGRILGLHEGSNFQQVTVWVDSVAPSLDPDFTTALPYSWFSFVDASVTGGVVNYANFSANDGIYSVRLNSALFSLGNFSQGYSANGSVTFYALPSITPAVPDSSSTVLLLGSGLGMVLWLRRKLR